MSEDLPLVGLITGPIGAGKSTACQRALAIMRSRGYTVGGVLTPAIHDESGGKTGIAIVDLATGEKRVLGRLDQGQPGLQVGKYKFDPESLHWGERILEKAASDDLDVLVVDEVGPLEINRGRGFTQALTLLVRGIVPRLVIVVREALLEALHARAGQSEVIDFWVTEASRDHVFQEIADGIAPPRGSEVDPQRV